MLAKGDVLIVAGNVEKIKALGNKATEVIDANHTLGDATMAE